MFTDELAKIDWDETTARIAAKTDNDVRRALGKAHFAGSRAVSGNDGGAQP